MNFIGRWAFTTTLLLLFSCGMFWDWDGNWNWG
jgi:hypothetical protein